tara:strand:- start:145 stop:573 length:429 start_codon:yes stop_codon:yes gene_type:complete
LYGLGGELLELLLQQLALLVLIPLTLHLFDLVVAALPRHPQRGAAAVPVDLGALERPQLGRPAEVAAAERRQQLLSIVCGDDRALAQVGKAGPAVSSDQDLRRVDVVVDEPPILHRPARVHHRQAHQHAEGDELERLGLLEG